MAKSPWTLENLEESRQICEEAQLKATRLREGIPEALRERAKTDSFCLRVVKSIEFGGRPEEVYVEAIIIMSQAIEELRGVLLDQYQHGLRPIYIVASPEQMERLKQADEQRRATDRVDPARLGDGEEEPPGRPPYASALTEWRRRYLGTALEEAAWNVSVAARNVGLSRVGLSKAVRALGLKRPARKGRAA